jgi:hypothetical protein
MVTNAEVQIMYSEFNKKYFRNRLPKDMVVHFVHLKDQHGITKTYRGRPMFVWLDWRLRVGTSHTALTLLHEMVHIENPKWEHGPRFQKRMLKLAKQKAFNPYW